MKTPCFDIVIIGAGPAGSAAAYTAAESGASVLLIEEHEKIGTPVSCAEGLSRSTIKDYLSIKPEWISRRLKGAIIRGPDHEEFKIEYPDVGWVLDRTIFDAALAEYAEEKGTVIKKSTRAIGVENNKVIVRESGQIREYRFKFLIGADGVLSRVGSWKGIDTRLGLNEIEVCAEYLLEDINVDTHYAYLIFGSCYAPGGYAWIFPKSDNTANVGLGISPLKTKKRAQQFLDEWIEREFPEAKTKRKVFGGVPAKILKKFSGDDFFLVGDAARFTDPLSGAGIANGIKSGVIAGRNAVLKLKGKKDHFKAEIKREILKEIKYHLKIRNIYVELNDEEYRIIFNIGKKLFEGKTTRDINVREIVKEVLYSSPRIFWRAIKDLF